MNEHSCQNFVELHASGFTPDLVSRIFKRCLKRWSKDKVNLGPRRERGGWGAFNIGHGLDFVSLPAKDLCFPLLSFLSHYCCTVSHSHRTLPFIFLPEKGPWHLTVAIPLCCLRHGGLHSSGLRCLVLCGRENDFISFLSEAPS